MKKQLKEAVISAISEATELDIGSVAEVVETPKNRNFGDIAFPCFELAKLWKTAPNKCAETLQEKLTLPDGISEVIPTGPFLNFKFSRSPYIGHVVVDILRSVDKGRRVKENPSSVVLEYSSPNIAKPFHVGHLRATLIGNSLDRAYRYLGENVISINHLGDWGTQFGFVWAGCKLWGKPEDPSVAQLVELYRRATKLKDDQEKQSVSDDDAQHPDVNDIARAYFKDLEKGEQYAVDFWQWCLDISMVYFKDTYGRLNVNFDHYIGESFYSDKLDAVKQSLEEANILVESKNALGVELTEELGFARVFTPDGRSLYLTRDIASAEYRAATFSFDKAIYVVGAPQTLHFQQLVGVLQKLGRPWAAAIEHVAFGHVMGMKTRGEGGAIELNEFLEEAQSRALAAYNDQVTKRPEGLDENEVASKVALAAIVFSNLSRGRLKDVHFSWDNALAFQGDTGPYLLYAYARINGIKEKARENNLHPAEKFDAAQLCDDHAYRLVTLLAEFDDALAQAISESEPACLANYALDLAKTFSKAYNELKVIGVDAQLATARLTLFESVRITLGRTLQLLGIEPLERM